MACIGEGRGVPCCWFKWCLIVFGARSLRFYHALSTLLSLVVVAAFFFLREFIHSYT
jgi:hypothetical protein